MRIKEATKMNPQPPQETQRIVPLGEMTGSFECLSEKGEFLAAILTVKFGMIPRRIGSVWYWVIAGKDEQGKQGKQGKHEIT